VALADEEVAAAADEAEADEAEADDAGDAIEEEEEDGEEEAAAAAANEEASSSEVSADRHSSKHAPMLGSICGYACTKNANKAKIKTKLPTLNLHSNQNKIEIWKYEKN
jgi:hypothetical protein